MVFGFLKSAWEKVIKPVVTFDIKEYAPKGEKVLTGTLPIGGVGATAVKLASKTGTILKTTAKVIKAVTPKTILGKATAVTTGLIGYGILKESPKAREVALTTITELPKKPAKIISLGGEVGKVIEGEKVLEKEKIIGGLKTAGVVGGVAVAGAVIIPKVIEKVKEMKEKPLETPTTTDTPEKQLVPEKPLGQAETPITPQTTTITTGKKPTRRRRATKITSVRQSVRVNVINRATGIRVQNKRYLYEMA